MTNLGMNNKPGHGKHNNSGSSGICNSGSSGICIKGVSDQTAVCRIPTKQGVRMKLRNPEWQSVCIIRFCRVHRSTVLFWIQGYDWIEYKHKCNQPPVQSHPEPQRP